MGAIVFLGSQRLGDFTDDSPIKIRPMLSSAYHSLHIELGMDIDRDRDNVINRELFVVDPLVNSMTAEFIGRADPEFGKIFAAVADLQGDKGVMASDQGPFVITFLATKDKHPRYFRLDCHLSGSRLAQANGRQHQKLFNVRDVGRQKFPRRAWPKLDQEILGDPH